MSNVGLFAPKTFGALSLKNSLVLAPLTRARANDHGVPSELAAVYYAQRAQAGLLITEATQISFEGMGYPRTPGIHDPAQLDAWRRIVETVHGIGGTFVCQLWHVGRVANTINRGRQADVVAPSALQLEGQMYTDAQGMQPHSQPRALETHEIGRLAEQYAKAAANAQAVGFDGVEFHCANGYLMHQFLSSNVNRRTDRYGGSIENRARAPLEILDAILTAVPADRVGIRVSPTHAFNSIEEADSEDLYRYFYAELAKRRLAYLHVMRPFTNTSSIDSVANARAQYPGNLIACGGYDAASGHQALSEDTADAIAYGKLFIANPDLPLRLHLEAPLAEPNAKTFYTPGAKGYTDYPAWQGA